VTLTVHELEGDAGRSEIDIAVLLDRSVDLVSPLVTPLTYEALLDEVVGLDSAMATVEFNVVYDEEPPAPGAAVPPPLLAPSAASRGKVVVHLNSNDKLYAEIRDQNVEVAGAKLQSRAKELLALEDSVRKGNSAEMKVADLKKFVKSIPGLQQDKKALRICINLLEMLKARFNDAAFIKQWRLERDALDEENVKALLDHVSSLFATQAPKEEALRLLCLQCAIEGGLKQKTLDALRRELLQAYGFNELALPLFQLERCGLLNSRETAGFIGSGQSRSWATLRRTFGLTATDVNLEDPADIHFVTSGYAPLSVRLVQVRWWGAEAEAEVGSRGAAVLVSYFSSALPSCCLTKCPVQRPAPTPLPRLPLSGCCGCRGDLFSRATLGHCHAHRVALGVRPCRRRRPFAARPDAVSPPVAARRPPGTAGGGGGGCCWQRWRWGGLLQCPRWRPQGSPRRVRRRRVAHRAGGPALPL
jgi:hypothetical protein